MYILEKKYHCDFAEKKPDEFSFRLNINGENMLYDHINDIFTVIGQKFDKSDVRYYADEFSCKLRSNEIYPDIHETIHSGLSSGIPGKKLGYLICMGDEYLTKIDMDLCKRKTTFIGHQPNRFILMGVCGPRIYSYSDRNDMSVYNHITKEYNDIMRVNIISFSKCGDFLHMIILAGHVDQPTTSEIFYDMKEQKVILQNNPGDSGGYCVLLYMSPGKISIMNISPRKMTDELDGTLYSGCFPVDHTTKINKLQYDNIWIASGFLPDSPGIGRIDCISPSVSPESGFSQYNIRLKYNNFIGFSEYKNRFTIAYTQKSAENDSEKYFLSVFYLTDDITFPRDYKYLPDEMKKNILPFLCAYKFRKTVLSGLPVELIYTISKYICVYSGKKISCKRH